MGRVEMRMYKRKQSRARLYRMVVLLLLVIGAALLIWPKLPASFFAERLTLPTATPLASGFDKTVETRETALPAEIWYAIQTGVFSTKEAAVDKADAYTERGAPGVVVQEGEKWRVFIACYGTEEEAAAVRTRLGENQRVDTYLYSWACPELRLRLTGMAGQLDVVEAGFTLLSSTAAGLRDTAIELDAAQLTAAEVLAAAEEIDNRIMLWESTVHSRFGQKLPALVKGMLQITGNWQARKGRILSAGDATELSAALKAEAMGMYDEIGAWRASIAAQ